MLLKNPSVLGIELAQTWLRVVRGCIVSGRLVVEDFSQEELLFGNEDTTTPQLQALVEKRNVRRSHAALMVSGPEVVHRVLEFPPMPARELTKVVERELRVMGTDEKKDLVFDWEVLEESKEGSLKQVRVLAAMAPRNQVDHVVRLLENSQLKPSLIVTPPIALLRALKFLEGGREGLGAVLYLGPQQCYLLGVKDGVWGFYREFSTGSTPAEDNLVEETLREANRVRAYYSQRYRDADPPVFLLCGERKLEDFRTRLEREIGVQVKVVQPSTSVDLRALKEREMIFRDLFPTLILPLGLAVSSYAKHGINLLPKWIRNPVWARPSLDFSFVRRPAWVFGLLIIFLVVHLFLVRSERTYTELKRERIALYAQWQPAFQEAEKSRELHAWQELLQKSFGSSRVEEMPWVGLFKAISSMAPRSLLLQSMNLEIGESQWKIILKGQVVSSDLYGAQAAFNQFYQGLKNSPYVENLELMPLKVSSFKERIKSSGRGGTDSGKRVGSKNGEGEAEGENRVPVVTKTRVQFELIGKTSRA